MEKTPIQLGLDQLSNQINIEPKTDPIQIEVNTKTEKEEENPIDTIEIQSSAPKDTESSSSQYLPFANYLKEQGLISEDLLTEETEIKSVDDLKEIFNKQKERDYEAIKQSMFGNSTEEVKSFINMLESGVPLEEAKQITKNNSDISTLLKSNYKEDADVQEKIVRSYLSKLDLDENEINDQIEYLKDTEKLSEKATTFADKLKEISAYEEETAKKRAAEREIALRKDAEQQISKLKDTITSKSELIPGRKISEKEKENIFKSMTTAVGQDPTTGQPLNAVAVKRMQNPVEFEIMLHYLNEIGVFDGKFDKIITAAKSKATEELERALSSTSSKSGSSPNFKPDQNTQATSELLNSFKQAFKL